MIKDLLHHFIAWYLRRCAGAFHVYPYGEGVGRYVVLMSEREYHLLNVDRDYSVPKSWDRFLGVDFSEADQLDRERKKMYKYLDEMIGVFENPQQDHGPNCFCNSCYSHRSVLEEIERRKKKT